MVQPMRSLWCNFNIQVCILCLVFSLEAVTPVAPDENMLLVKYRGKDYSALKSVFSLLGLLLAYRLPI